MRSSSSPLAVSITSGSPAVAGSRLSSRASSRPSRPGNIRSRTTRSGRRRRIASSALSPRRSTATVKPARSRLNCRTSAMSGSSSTTRTRVATMPARLACAPPQPSRKSLRKTVLRGAPVRAVLGLPSVLNRNLCIENKSIVMSIYRSASGAPAGRGGARAAHFPQRGRDGRITPTINVCDSGV